jgi:hypothetical protein
MRAPSQPHDAITAFAVPNPNCSSQNSRFFPVWLPGKLPYHNIIHATTGAIHSPALPDAFFGGCPSDPVLSFSSAMRHRPSPGKYLPQDIVQGPSAGSVELGVELVGATLAPPLNGFAKT